jgi:hypothetical protein
MAGSAEDADKDLGSWAGRGKGHDTCLPGNPNQQFSPGAMMS